jgi:hypothetical protein
MPKAKLLPQPTLRHKSMKLKELLPPLDSDRDATFVSLQKGSSIQGSAGLDESKPAPPLRQ